MKHLWLDFLGTGAGLAVVSLMLRLILWGDASLWRVALWGLAFFWALWLIQGALLLAIALLEWCARRAR